MHHVVVASRVEQSPEFLPERTAVRILDDAFEARVRDVERLRFWWRAWRVGIYVAAVHTIASLWFTGTSGAWTVLLPLACVALRRWFGQEVLLALEERHAAALELQNAEVALARAIKASGVFRRDGAA